MVRIDFPRIQVGVWVLQSAHDFSRRGFVRLRFCVSTANKHDVSNSNSASRPGARRDVEIQHWRAGQVNRSLALGACIAKTKRLVEMTRKKWVACGVMEAGVRATGSRNGDLRWSVTRRAASYASCGLRRISGRAPHRRVREVSARRADLSFGSDVQHHRVCRLARPAGGLPFRFDCHSGQDLLRVVAAGGPQQSFQPTVARASVPKTLRLDGRAQGP